jgi:SAM-dependent methyltransferase
LSNSEDSSPAITPGSSRGDEDVRTQSFGQHGRLSPLDRLGVWLSCRRLKQQAGGLAGKKLGDFGCGYQARFVRDVLPVLREAVVVDVALAPDLKAIPHLTAIEGPLPDALEDLPNASFDVITCVSVLEHLSRPADALKEFRRLLAPGGVCLVNVPSWWGKWALELSAFRLGLSPREEMDDHKAYYDPRDLWPLLIAAGFLPHQVQCRRYKLGLNTFARCRLD